MLFLANMYLCYVGRSIKHCVCQISGSLFLTIACIWRKFHVGLISLSHSLTLQFPTHMANESWTKNEPTSVIERQCRAENPPLSKAKKLPLQVLFPLLTCCLEHPILLTLSPTYLLSHFYTTLTPLSSLPFLSNPVSLPKNLLCWKGKYHLVTSSISSDMVNYFKWLCQNNLIRRITENWLVLETFCFVFHISSTRYNYIWSILYKIKYIILVVIQTLIRHVVWD